MQSLCTVEARGTLVFVHEMEYRFFNIFVLDNRTRYIRMFHTIFWLCVQCGYNGTGIFQQGHFSKRVYYTNRMNELFVNNFPLLVS